MTTGRFGDVFNRGVKYEVDSGRFGGVFNREVKYDDH
jgi:hypothetical protein